MEKTFQFLKLGKMRPDYKTTYYIITGGEKGRPMYFDGRQLVYPQVHGRARSHAEIYTKEDAQEMIKKTLEWRKKQGFSQHITYELQKVNFPY